MEVEPETANGFMFNATVQSPAIQARGKTQTKRQKNAMKKQRIILATLALAATTTALSAADATTTWEKQCKACHGSDGKGQTPQGKKLGLKDFADAAFQASFTDAQATKAIKEGVKDGDKTRMKAADDVTDADIKDLVAKVRAFKK
jgi:mono/diheme cytochrome c family protein